MVGIEPHRLFDPRNAFLAVPDPCQHEPALDHQARIVGIERQCPFLVEFNLFEIAPQ